MSAGGRRSKKNKKNNKMQSEIRVLALSLAHICSLPSASFGFFTTFCFAFLSLNLNTLLCFCFAKSQSISIHYRPACRNSFGQFSRAHGRCSSFAFSPRVNMYFMSRRNAPAGIAISLIKCSALSLRLITQADELIPDDSGSRLQGALSTFPHPTPPPLGCAWLR